MKVVLSVFAAIVAIVMVFIFVSYSMEGFHDYTVEKSLRTLLGEGYAVYADPSGDFHVDSGDLYVSGDIYGGTGNDTAHNQ